jgi:DNA invertase Pin-like site-specific DNA recombinase
MRCRYDWIVASLLTARQGKYIGGQPKLGLDIVDRRYAINKDEAKLVRRIFTLAVQLQSCQKIADTLNGEGTRSKIQETSYVGRMLQLTSLGGPKLRILL